MIGRLARSKAELRPVQIWPEPNDENRDQNLASSSHSPCPQSIDQQYRPLFLGDQEINSRGDVNGLLSRKPTPTNGQGNEPYYLIACPTFSHRLSHHEDVEINSDMDNCGWQVNHGKPDTYWRMSMKTKTKQRIGLNYLNLALAAYQSFNLEMDAPAWETLTTEERQRWMNVASSTVLEFQLQRRALREQE